MMTTRSDFRNALLCACIAIAALLLAWPFAEIGFNDDWSWALTVKQLQASGHLVYNGWSSPPVIAQAYWGLLWVKVFGFSHNILRISTLPLAAGSIAITYGLGRLAGLNAALSRFAALTLGLSPLLMPLESSFMTDVPGLFFLLFSMFALLVGYKKSSIGWIFAGAILALVGGSSRQIVWIVPLITLPYFAWLRRSHRLFTAAAGISWLLVFCGAVATQHWFGKQPYSLPDPPASSYLHQLIIHPRRQVISMLWVALTLMLFILPITVASIRRLSLTRLALALAITTILLGITHHFGNRRDWIARTGLMPWMSNIITITGVLSSNELTGDRPVSLTPAIRIIGSITVLAVTGLLLSSAILKVRQARITFKHIFDYFCFPSDGTPAVQAMLLTTAAYLGLELTRAMFDVAFDRHLLPLISFMGIGVLVCFQYSGLTKMPAISSAMLVIFAVYGTAITQELSALARTRLAAIQRLKDAGVRDDQIDAGFEHDYPTQASISGHINDARLRTPPGAYDPSKGPLPDLLLLYRLERKPTGSTMASPFGQLDYFSLLPPFHRTVCIDRFKTPTPAPSRQILPQLLIEQYK